MHSIERYNLYIDLFGSQKSEGEEETLSVGGPVSFSFFSDVHGRAFYLMGDVHLTLDRCEGREDISLEDWIEQVTRLPINIVPLRNFVERRKKIMEIERERREEEEASLLSYSSSPSVPKRKRRRSPSLSRDVERTTSLGRERQRIILAKTKYAREVFFETHLRPNRARFRHGRFPWSKTMLTTPIGKFEVRFRDLFDLATPSPSARFVPVDSRSFFSESENCILNNIYGFAGMYTYSDICKKIENGSPSKRYTSYRRNGESRERERRREPSSFISLRIQEILKYFIVFLYSESFFLDYYATLFSGCFPSQDSAYEFFRIPYGAPPLSEHQIAINLLKPCHIPCIEEDPSTRDPYIARMTTAINRSPLRWNILSWARKEVLISASNYETEVTRSFSSRMSDPENLFIPNNIRVRENTFTPRNYAQKMVRAIQSFVDGSSSTSTTWNFFSKWFSSPSPPLSHRAATQRLNREIGIPKKDLALFCKRPLINTQIWNIDVAIMDIYALAKIFSPESVVLGKEVWIYAGNAHIGRYINFFQTSLGKMPDYSFDPGEVDIDTTKQCVVLEKIPLPEEKEEKREEGERDAGERDAGERDAGEREREEEMREDREEEKREEAQDRQEFIAKGRRRFQRVTEDAEMIPSDVERTEARSRSRSPLRRVFDAAIQPFRRRRSASRGASWRTLSR